MLFGNGFIIAFLYLFLRANAARMAIKPPETPWQAQQHGFRFFGPNDLEILNISSPISLNSQGSESALSSDEKKRPLDAWESQAAWERSPEGSQYSAKQARSIPKSSSSSKRTPELLQLNFTPSISSNGSVSSRRPLPAEQFQVPEVLAAARASSPTQLDGAVRSAPAYSLFPSGEINTPRLPPAIHSPFGSGAQGKFLIPSTSNSYDRQSAADIAQGLQAPSAPFAQSAAHRRAGSADSSATVNICLRLSSFPSSIIAPRTSKRLYDPQSKAVTDPSPLRHESTTSLIPLNLDARPLPQSPPILSTTPPTEEEDAIFDDASNYDEDAGGVNPFRSPPPQAPAPGFVFLRDESSPTPTRNPPQRRQVQPTSPGRPVVTRSNSKLQKYESQYCQNPFASQDDSSVEMLSASVYSPSGSSPVETLLSSKAYSPPWRNGSTASKGGEKGWI